MCRPSSRCPRLPYSVERDLTDVIEGELRLQREVDSLKRSLKYGCDYSAIAAFDSVDSPRIGRIDHYNLKCFLNRTCAYPTDGEVTAIIRRIDLDGDQNLSFSEWDQFLREPYVCPCPPKQPSPRPQRSASPLRGESKAEASPAKQVSPAKDEEKTVKKSSEDERPVSTYVPSYYPRYWWRYHDWRDYDSLYYPYYSKYYDWPYYSRYYDYPYYKYSDWRYDPCYPYYYYPRSLWYRYC